VRLSDFTRDGSPIDLTQIDAINFLFGPTYGSAQGESASTT
jgi:hypothetical protein